MVLSKSEQLRLQSAVNQLRPRYERKIKALSAARWKPRSRLEAFRLKRLRVAWNLYYHELIRAIVRVRIEVAQDDPALTENEALGELQNEIVAYIKSVDSVRMKQVESEYAAAGLGELLADHYLDVADLTEFADTEIRYAKFKRDPEQGRVGLRFPAVVQFLVFGAIKILPVFCSLGPLLVGVWLLRDLGHLLLRTEFSILGSFLMCYFVYPAIRDGLLMVILLPAWISQNPLSIPLRGPLPNTLTLFVSNFSEAYVVVYLASLALARLTIWRGPDALQQWTWFASIASVILTCVFLYGQRKRGRNILLLRRFDRAVSLDVKKGLVPTLAAYGEVTTAKDGTFDRAYVPQLEGLPQSRPASVLSFAREEWQEDVRKQIAQADLIVIDMSEISAAVAWEFLQSVRRSEPCPIILVSSARHLATNRSTLFRGVVSELNGYADDAESLVRSLEPPVAYSRSIINVVFSVRLYRRIRRMVQLQRAAAHVR
jgi:hypothetical protein